MNIIQVILYIMIHSFLWIPVHFHQLHFALEMNIFSLIGSRFHVSKKEYAELSPCEDCIIIRRTGVLQYINSTLLSIGVSSTIWWYIRLNVKPSLLFSQSKYLTGQIIITYMLNLVKVKVTIISFWFISQEQTI